MQGTPTSRKSGSNAPYRPINFRMRTGRGCVLLRCARVMARWLSERLGHQFVVENRAGAASNIGTEAALRTPLVVWSGHEPNHWRDFRYPWPATAAGAPKMKARFADLGGTVLALSPAEYGKRIAEETEKWGKVIKFSGATAD